MKNFGMEFSYCHSADGALVTVHLSEDSNLEQVADAFKSFLLAAGYGVEDVDISTPPQPK